MSRGRRKGSISETLEQQIVKEQEKVIKTKVAYDSAVDALQKLLDKRDAQRKDELWNAIVKSQRSYDEIMKYINTESKKDTE